MSLISYFVYLKDRMISGNEDTTEEHAITNDFGEGHYHFWLDDYVFLPSIEINLLGVTNEFL